MKTRLQHKNLPNQAEVPQIETKTLQHFHAKCRTKSENTFSDKPIQAKILDPKIQIQTKP